MSCHSTPGNRAATSLACALTSTPSDEVARRFHQLKSEAPILAPDCAPPTEDDLNNWLDRQALAVRTDQTLSEWRAERLLARIEEARSGGLPDAATWYAWANLRAACDEAHVHQWLAAQAGMNMPLTEMLPADIDDKLARIWEKLYVARDRRAAVLRDIRYNETNLGRFGLNRTTLESKRAYLTTLDTSIEKLEDEAAPLEAEYRRREGWSRYFRVVTSGEGHVHSSMRCRTCYPTTMYSWLPSLSGRGEDEAVGDYGSEMCSVCFPSVTSHPSYQTRGRIAEERAAELAAERAARAAVKAEKAITAPDGSPLRVGGPSSFRDTITTAVTAERTLVDRLTELSTRLSDSGIDRWVADYFTDDETKRASYREHMLAQREQARKDVTVLAEALAAKRGVAVADIMAVMESKAAAKARRQARS